MKIEMSKVHRVNAHVSRGGSLCDLPSMPGAASLPGSWRAVPAVEKVEPGGAWE